MGPNPASRRMRSPRGSRDPSKKGVPKRGLFWGYPQMGPNSLSRNHIDGRLGLASFGAKMGSQTPKIGPKWGYFGPILGVFRPLFGGFILPQAEIGPKKGPQIRGRGPGPLSQGLGPWDPVYGVWGYAPYPASGVPPLARYCTSCASTVYGVHSPDGLWGCTAGAVYTVQGLCPCTVGI